jgi:lysophospholipase L1-like esterase
MHFFKMALPSKRKYFLFHMMITKKTRPHAFSLLILASSASIALAGMTGGRTPADAVTPVENSRHTKLLEEIRQRNGKIDFVLIGDSITDFWPGKGKDSYAEFAAWNPLDLGVSGEQTEQVLRRLLNGELDGYKAKAIMIMIGTNNIGHFSDEKPEWVAAGIKKIVETVKEKQPQAKILLLAIFPRGATAEDNQNKRVIETNKLLPSLADGKTVFYMDIGKIFLDEQGNAKKELMPDFLHPNADGYKLWLEAVKPKLSELMK